MDKLIGTFYVMNADDARYDFTMVMTYLVIKICGDYDQRLLYKHKKLRFMIKKMIMKRKDEEAVNKIFIYTKGFHEVYQKLND